MSYVEPLTLLNEIISILTSMLMIVRILTILSDSLNPDIQSLLSNPRRLLMELYRLKSTSQLVLIIIPDFNVLLLADISMLSLSFSLS